MSIEKRVTRWLGFDIRYFLRQGSWSVLGDGIQLVLGVLLLTVFARLASQEVFGQYQFITALAATFSLIGMNGFDVVLTRDAARGKDGVYKRAVALRQKWSLLAFPLLGSVSGYFWLIGDRALAGGLFITAVAMPFYLGTRSWLLWLRGKGNFSLTALYLIGLSAAQLAVLSAVLWRHGSALLLIVGFNAFVVITINGLYYWRSLAFVQNDEVSDDWRSYGYSLTRLLLFKQILVHADKVLVGFLFSPAVLALYVAATLLPGKGLQLLKSLMQTVIPRISVVDRLRSRDLWLLLLFGLMLGLVSAGLQGFVIRIVFGVGYEKAILFGYIASGVLVFFPASALAEHFAYLTKQRRAVWALTILTPIFKLVGMISLGWLFGLGGFVMLFALMPMVRLLFTLVALQFDLTEAA